MLCTMLKLEIHLRLNPRCTAPSEAWCRVLYLGVDIVNKKLNRAFSRDERGAVPHCTLAIYARLFAYFDGPTADESGLSSNRSGASSLFCSARSAVHTNAPSPSQPTWEELAWARAQVCSQL